MPTETSLPIDLDSPEVREFANSTASVFRDPTYDARRQFLLDDGYINTGLKRQGPKFNPADHVPMDNSTGTNGVLGVMQAEIKTYDLVEYATGAIQSQVETQIIHSQSIEISVWHELLISGDVPEEDREAIRTAFENYVDSPDTNPDDFAAANDIPAASYEALAFFEIEKTESPTIDDRQDVEIRNYYIGSETHRLELRGSRFEEIKERDDGSVEVDDPEDSDGAIDIIRDIVEQSPAMRCENIQYEQKRIATLIQYPEFKIRWRRVVIKIGCVRISIKVPQLLYRNNKRVLYAGLAYSVDVGQIVVDVFVHCLVKSALAASIAGLATANIGVAGAAFKALFTECIKQQLGAYVKCLLPELVLLKERDGWRPV